MLLQLPVSVATNVAKYCATIRLICGQPAERDPTHLPTLSAGQNNPLLGPVYVYEDVDVVGQHVGKGVRKNGGLPLAVYWFCRCGYARYFTGYTNTTSADDTYSTQPQRDTHTGAHTIKMIALACDDRMSGGYAMKQPGCI